MPAKTSQLYIGDGEYVEKTSREITLTSEVKAKIDNIPAVVNTFDSASTTDALSAAAGKQLKDLIDSVWTIWKYLSAWDCATWLPVTDPIDNPHLYKVWDYYVISNVAASSWTNYRPDSVKYEHWVASTAVETWTPALNDSYYYDWVQWVLQPSGWRTIVIDSSLSSTSTNPVENRIINSALNWKQATISDLATIRSWAALGATAIQPGANISTLTNNSWFVTSGTVDNKITTATSNFVTSSIVDSKITAATTDFVTSNEVDTQIGTALTTWNYTTATDVSSAISTATQWMVTETSLATKGYQTQWEVNAAISNATLHMAETWDNITEFVNNAWYQTASQVSNTVNTAVAGKQDTLVSWTNIKTVNWTSILGSWNINIQWGGECAYDAVVWTWGEQYNTIWEAFAAWKRNIFVKNWTYYECDWFNVTDWYLTIVWESRDWVKVNIPANCSCVGSMFINMGSTPKSLFLKNISFNITFSNVNCFVRSSNVAFDLRVEDCNFIYSTTHTYNDYLFYCTKVIDRATWSDSQTICPKNPYSWMYRCNFYTEANKNNRVVVWYWDSYFDSCKFETGVTAWEMSFVYWGNIFKNCYMNVFQLDWWDMHFYDSVVEIKTWWLLEQSNNGSTPNGIDLNLLKNSSFEIRWILGENPTDDIRVWLIDHWSFKTADWRFKLSIWWWIYWNTIRWWTDSRISLNWNELSIIHTCNNCCFSNCGNVVIWWTSSWSAYNSYMFNYIESTHIDIWMTEALFVWNTFDWASSSSPGSITIHWSYSVYMWNCFRFYNITDTWSNNVKVNNITM